MTIPFVYSLSFTNPDLGLKQWYIGVKYGKDSSPSDLWTSYFSSSKIIESLIKEHGPKAFKTKIVKVFSDEVSARFYEERLIRRAIRFGLKLNVHLINRGIPNKNFSNSMKGRKFEEIFSPEVCARLKSKLREPKSKETIQKMVETRIKNGSYFTGEDHAMAKQYTLISPEGEIHVIKGKLKSFCEDNNLSWQTLFTHINKGVIPKELDRTKYKNISRLSDRFWNTLGWEIKQLF